MYKLIIGKNEYITQTHRKYFKIALNYCLKNKCDSCRVNRTYFHFDFRTHWDHFHKDDPGIHG